MVTGIGEIKMENFRKALDKIKKQKYLEYLLLAVIVVQFLFILYTNLTKIPATLDNDAAKVFIHAMEMWKHKTFFVPAWKNMTTLEVDCSTLLALPIYGITKDIYKSFGAANVLILAVYIYIFNILMNRLNSGKIAKYMAIIMLMIPFGFGQLMYYNMMFFAAGQYNIKVLVPLMMLIVIISEKLDLETIIIGVVCIFLTCILGISSGPYVIATGIIPILAGYILFDLLKRNKITELANYKTYFIILEILAAYIGEKICLRADVNDSVK